MEWSIKYAECQDCGTTNNKHQAKGLCCVCYMREYYKKNREKILSYVSVYQKNNKVKIAEYQKSYSEKNTERLRRQRKEYATKNKEAIKEKGKRYREKNRQSIRERGKKYYRENKKSFGEKSREYYLTNKETIIARVKAWKKNNPEKERARKMRHRSRKVNAKGTLSGEEIIKLKDIYGNACMNPACNKIITRNNPMTLDHIVPLVMNGTNEFSNLQILCRSCNASKGTKTIDYRRFNV